MSENLNASPEISETLKSKESGTDDIIDADLVYNTLSAKAINVAKESLFFRTLINRPENEDALRGMC